LQPVVNLIFDRCGTDPKGLRIVKTILVLTFGRAAPVARDSSFSALVWVFMVKTLKYNKNKLKEKRRKHFPTVHGSQLYIGAPKTNQSVTNMETATTVSSCPQMR
jgi:hypothetical protein